MLLLRHICVWVTVNSHHIIANQQHTHRLCVLSKLSSTEFVPATKHTLTARSVKKERGKTYFINDGAYNQFFDPQREQRETTQRNVCQAIIEHVRVTDV